MLIRLFFFTRLRFYSDFKHPDSFRHARVALRSISSPSLGWFRVPSVIVDVEANRVNDTFSGCSVNPKETRCVIFVLWLSIIPFQFSNILQEFYTIFDIISFLCPIWDTWIREIYRTSFNSFLEFHKCSNHFVLYLPVNSTNSSIFATNNVPDSFSFLISIGMKIYPCSSVDRKERWITASQLIRSTGNLKRDISSCIWDLSRTVFLA